MPKNMNTKDIIFKSAIDLFSKHGYIGTSVRKIAKQSGIKESSIYNHYKNKKEILDSILSYQIDEFKKIEKRLDEYKLESEEPIDAWVEGINLTFDKDTNFLEPITKMMINEMFINNDCLDFTLDILYDFQKKLTKKMLIKMKDKFKFIGQDLELTAENYIYMLKGLDIENKLLELKGQHKSESYVKLISHIKIFISNIFSK